MKIICDTQILSEACMTIQRIVSTKTTIPAIEGILIKALGNELILTGFDLEIGMNTSIPARVEQAGSIVINAKIFCDILRHIPNETICIEVNDEKQQCKITSGDIEYNLTCISASEYPELPTVESGFPVVVEQDVLKEMIRQTIFAVATTDTKVIHTGVKFEISNRQIKLIALDGFRLAIRTEDIDYTGDDISFVVPSKTLSEVSKIIGEEEGTVSINVGKRHIIFESNNYFIISRLLEGEFLNYKSAIPLSGTTLVKVDRRDLIESIERTSLFISERIKSPLRCLFKDNEINISSITAMGTANDKISAEIEGNDVEIGFNNKFLLDALKASDVDRVKIELGGAVSPITIVPEDKDHFLFLVLPVRLKTES